MSQEMVMGDKLDQLQRTATAQNVKFNFTAQMLLVACMLLIGMLWWTNLNMEERLDRQQEMLRSIMVSHAMSHQHLTEQMANIMARQREHTDGTQPAGTRR
jgi:hypothetical protein